MTQDWSNKIILIAEDEPANYLFLEKIIKTTQALIIRAENGSEAIEHATKNPSIDLVLMDIFMPDVDGFAAAKKIKSIRPDLPIVAQTFYQQEMDAEKYEEAGFNAVIRKPININKLLAVLERFLKSEV